MVAKDKNKRSQRDEKSLSEWVDYIQTLHRRNIDLSLDRVRLVYQRLFPYGIDFKVVTVAGTNGKGSTTELLRAIYTANGQLTAKYTSPHLVRFNERYQIGDKLVEDQQLVDAFKQIEQARQDTTLTFFEFGTLAAFLVFADAKIDIAIMEVGLGGRLDAVNVLDADAVAITNIAIDHTAWLGDSIEKIGYEKVGVVRSGRPCVIGMQKPPQSIAEYCQDNKVPLTRYQQDFEIVLDDDKRHWDWSSQQQDYKKLSLPFGQTGHQLVNAAVALAVVEQMQTTIEVKPESIKAGLKSASLLGRCQVLQESPEIILDVSHNVASVKQLATFLSSRTTPSKRYAICGMLEDKQIEQALSEMIGLVDEWHLASIDSDRGATAKQVQRALIKTYQSNNQRLPSIILHQNAHDAYQVVTKQLKTSGSLLVFGSFYLVGDIIRAKIAS